MELIGFIIIYGLGYLFKFVKKATTKAEMADDLLDSFDNALPTVSKTTTDDKTQNNPSAERSSIDMTSDSPSSHKKQTNKGKQRRLIKDQSLTKTSNKRVALADQYNQTRPEVLEENTEQLQVNAIQPIQKKIRKKAGHLSKVNHSSIRQAILWKEVLDKPLALRK